MNGDMKRMFILLMWVILGLSAYAALSIITWQEMPDLQWRIG